MAEGDRQSRVGEVPHGPDGLALQHSPAGLGSAQLRDGETSLVRCARGAGPLSLSGRQRPTDPASRSPVPPTPLGRGEPSNFDTASQEAERHYEVEKHDPHAMEAPSGSAE